MTDSAPPTDPLNPDTDPAVAATVRLLHRRRGWAWTLVGSLTALVAFIAIGVNAWPNATGATATICGVILMGLLALALAALTTVIVDTFRLRGRHPAVRAGAASRVRHHPLATHPFRSPVHHRVSHVFAFVFMALWIGLAVAFVPDQVNAVAYAVGAGNSVTFTPQSYSQVCGRGGCSNDTNGVLETNPPISATWPHQVPLDQPFKVRQPIWDGWGSPTVLMDGASAVGAILGALFFDIPAIAIMFELVHVARRKLRRQLDPTSFVTTSR
jgi:hypothetical protein